MTTNGEQLEDLYGPLARYSDHKPGDTIRYRSLGVEHTGTIIWVCVAGVVVEGRPAHPLRYIVENTYQGWPDTVYPQEIVEDAESQEPTLSHCPYCGGMHETSKVEQCPNNKSRK